MSSDIYYNEDKTKLIFSFYFNEPIDNFDFPNTLKTIVFGHCFNQNIDNVKFPDSLVTIVFDSSFQQKIDNIKFPDSLETIIFNAGDSWFFHNYIKPKLLLGSLLYNDTNVSIQLKKKSQKNVETINNFCLYDNVSNNLSDYTSLKNLTITTLNQNSYKYYTTNLVLPESLETITFGKNFNVNIDYIKFYNNLRIITFGDAFNQPLENVSFPQSVLTISFGDSFDKSLNNVKLPTNLQTLKFGKNFNQSLDKVILPQKLESMIFGEKFNQLLNNVIFPDSLSWIAFGHDYSQQLNNLPPFLKKLSFSKITGDLTNLPFTLEEIEIEVFYYNSSVNKIKKIPLGCEVKKWY